jgi:predicted kinase
MMATLHLMCGLPCAGKTTRARELEREHAAVRLTPDEWLVRLLGRDASLDVLRAARDPIESLMWELAERLLALGVDVVVDFGVWSRVERETFRARAARVGARSVLHYLDVPADVLVARLAERNERLPPGTFHIDPALLREWAKVFEPPTADELPPYESGRV